MKLQRKLYINEDPSGNITTAKDWYTTFQPTNVFRCTYILLWFKGNPIIKEITVGNLQQLAVNEIPASVLASPVSLEVIQEWFNNGVLDVMLTEHHVASLLLTTIKPSERLTMRIAGGLIDRMVLYGTELVPDIREMVGCCPKCKAVGKPGENRHKAWCPTLNEPRHIALPNDSPEDWGEDERSAEEICGAIDDSLFRLKD